MAAKETPWGTWDHLPLPTVVEMFRGFDRPWWIAGGYAIDAFAGGGRREHDDIDVSVFASDHIALRRHLAAWDVHVADPPGTLRPWALDEALPEPIHDIWVRRDSDDPWRFQVMLNPGDAAGLVYRRDSRLVLPLSEATWTKDGVRYLAPEFQLLFKSRGQRPKDERDFQDCLPLLDSGQRSWLSGALELSDPGNGWLPRLGTV